MILESGGNYPELGFRSIWISSLYTKSVESVETVWKPCGNLPHMCGKVWKLTLIDLRLFD